MGSFRRASLTPEEDERVRAATRSLVAECGSQARLAERLNNDPGQQTISKHLNGTPAGIHFAERIAGLLRRDVDDLLGRDRPARAAPILANAPGYEEAEAAARQLGRRIPEEAWQRVRAMSGAGIRVVDAEAVLGFARTWERVLAGQVEEYPDDGDLPPPKR